MRCAPSGRRHRLRQTGELVVRSAELVCRFSTKTSLLEVQAVMLGWREPGGLPPWARTDADRRVRETSAERQRLVVSFGRCRSPKQHELRQKQ
jgi:hypothetical protein